MPTYRIPTSNLRSIVNPLDGSMWKCIAITEEEVLSAKNDGKVESRCWEEVKDSIAVEEARDFHINRIATLLDQHDLGKLILCLENHTENIKCYFNDGNHRVAAAYIRNDPFLEIVIAASSDAKIQNVFPDAVLVH